MAYILGIDVGTSSVKVAVISEDGSCQTIREVYEKEKAQSPSGWWSAICAGTRKLSEHKEIVGIGLTTQVGTYILADEKSEQSRVYGWGSAGGEKQLQELYAIHSREFYKEHISMPLPKLISYPAPRLRWFASEYPNELNAAQKVLAPKDFLYHIMTGVYASDYFSWNGIVNMKTGDISDEMLALVGVVREKIPKLYHPTAAPGILLESAAKQLGLKTGIPVFLGCNDCHASLVGMGITSIGQSFDLTGTSEHVGIITSENDGDDAFTWSPYFEGTCAFGVTASSGRSIDWGFEQFGQYDDDIMGIYSDVASGRVKPPIFLPYLNGERSPIWDMNARGAFIGINGSTSKREMLYSVLEGVVLSIYHIWEKLPHNVGSVRLGGGASQNSVLGQLKADLFEKNLEIPREKESGALGAAMIACVGVGWFENLRSASNTFVSAAQIIKPANSSERLKERFEIYKNMYPKLKDTFGYFQ